MLVEVPVRVPMALVLPGIGVGPPQATSKAAAAPQSHTPFVRLNIFSPVMLTSLNIRTINRVSPKERLVQELRSPYTYHVKCSPFWSLGPSENARPIAQKVGMMPRASGRQ
jgi:hypothetical protein